MSARWNWLGVAAWLCASASGCSVDDREVAVGSLRGSDAGLAGGEGGSGSSPDGVARLAFQASVVDLGAVAVGFPARARLHLSNTGQVAVSQPELSWGVDSSADVSLLHHQCLGELAPGESCLLRVQFLPSAEGGAAASLQVASPEGGAATLEVVGRGLAPGAWLLDAAPGNFQNFGGALLGESRESVFTVRNPDAASLGPLSFSLNRSGFALLPTRPEDGPGCVANTSLARGESCQLRVAFTPTERGSVEAALTGTTASSGSVSLALSGEGLLPAALAVSTERVSFDGVVPGQAGQRRLSVENQGDALLTLSAARLEPADTGVFSILDSNCGADVELAGGQTCGFLLEYRPTQAGLESSAELVLEALGSSQPRRVPLFGLALQPGSLGVAALEDGGDDFGDVLLGQQQSRTFRVVNPAAQPSGVLSFRVSEGFEIEPAASGGGCIEGETSLVDGQSCSLSVRFAARRRDLTLGSLSVDSLLVGATSLGLSGRGIVPARLRVSEELDFGRVTASDSARRTLSVRNVGDLRAAPFVLAVAAAQATGTPAFSVEGSSCAEALDPFAECEATVSFSPRVGGHHVARLELSSSSRTEATALLLGRAVEPSALVLTAADASSSDFGDVQIGSTALRSFTLFNPEALTSGELLILTDESRFTVQPNDCAAGVVGGESCSFDVRFAPNDSSPIQGRLSVLSLALGEVSLELRGRGRSAASLVATTTRSLGQANVDQEPGPDNQFVWSVQNGGDYPTGPLVVSNENAGEFEIVEDGCAGQELGGQATCQVSIRFRPAAAGDRAGLISVTNPETSQAVALVVTGFGLRVAQLGEACVNATCVGGSVCTGGVCCAPSCESTCTTAGQCVECTLDAQCGANRRCEGNACVSNCLPNEELVNGQCLLRDGQACSINADRCRNTCRQWFPDADGDGFGDTSSTGIQRCGNQPPAAFVQNGDDCCDASDLYRPTQTGFFSQPVAACAGAGLDYDCNDRIETRKAARVGAAFNEECADAPGVRACNDRGGINVSPGNFAGVTASDLTDPVRVLELCFNSSVEYVVCQQVGAACEVLSHNLNPGCH